MNLSNIPSPKLRLIFTMRWIYRTLKGLKPAYESRIYESIDALPIVEEDTWNHPLWIGHVINSLNIVDSCQHANLNIHQTGLVSAVQAASIVCGKTDTITILDLGGGVGTYYPVIKRIASKIGLKLKYAVVDGAENCRNGTNIFCRQSDIRFFDFNHNGIESARGFLESVDVCNISSTLQYILDWRAALKNVSELNPTAICISRAPTPDNADQEGYVIQHVTSSLGYCGRVRVVLIPRTKLISELERLNYSLLSESGHSGDGNWYWQEGVSDEIFFQQTIRQFLFLSSGQRSQSTESTR
jgi:putative methyltransferase (TIGR04325 family)